MVRRVCVRASVSVSVAVSSTNASANVHDRDNPYLELVTVHVNFASAAEDRGPQPPECTARGTTTCCRNTLGHRKLQ